MPWRTETAVPVSKLQFIATLLYADRQNRKLLALFTAEPATVPVSKSNGGFRFACLGHSFSSEYTLFLFIAKCSYFLSP